MDDIQRIKSWLDHDLRLWTNERKRGLALKEKANTVKKHRDADKVIKDANEGIAETEAKLKRLSEIKEELKEVAS